ncbi:hypothetical protein DXG03_009265 [Asterophora parasitica]|uniref:Fe2OG dioxygenase domain-containing protein n=1 Tax=Asterophora parasitica TaxID=117018 RepID=A0A9P7K9Y4_9AGAR|nr:hypothetical protein DXG03_009265 [Asterophora parasitica]
MSTDQGYVDQLPLSFSGKAARRGDTRRRRQSPHAPTLDIGDTLGAGDSYLAVDVLPEELAEVAFENLIKEILKHPVNHVLIQHYRSGKDYISEHSDKTIDVVHGSNIVNVSLGAQRVMTLRLKGTRNKDQDEPVVLDAHGKPPPRLTQRFPLSNNSMFVMGPETNKKWLHGIRHDNRALQSKTEEELLQGGGRISLTFRHIGTFLTADESMIYGQGATGKSKEAACPVVIGGPEGAALIRAFGEENQRSDFNWGEDYGAGFNVLHFQLEHDD